MTLAIAAIVLLLALSALFSGTETAITGASQARLHGMEEHGDRRARIAHDLLEHRERLIGTLLISNNLVNTLAAALATNVLLRIFGDAGVAYATVIMTLLLVIFAEVLPKTYAIRHPESLSRAVAPLALGLLWVVGPLTSLVQFFVNGILRLFGGSPTTSLDTSLEVLRSAIAYHAAEGAVPKQERDMLGSILDLGDLEVGDVMVHRSAMVTIDADAPVADIVAQVSASPHTRHPVWRGDPDGVIGVLHAKDLFAELQRRGGNTEGLDVAALSSPPWFVPDTTKLSRQLLAFRQRRAHLALVVDEYGALLGLVTLEDILEEIVGEIEDEKDVVVEGLNVEPDGSVLVAGTTPLRDLNRHLEWDLPDEEAVTVAGLVIHEAQRIPDVGQVFAFHGFRFEVLERQRNQVTRLRIVPPAEPRAAAV